MKNRHWWSPQGEDAYRDDQRLERCDDVASLLTALFDGEANEDEARRARLHLLACQRCAEVFANWSQTRQILRSEASPPPPPTLLWRVIVACRVAGYSRKPAAKEATTPRGDALSPVPPALLKDSILASTVGTRPSRPVAVTPMWRRNAASWPALAVPAFAVWFLMLSGGQSSLELANRPVTQDAATTVQTVSRPWDNKPSVKNLKRIFTSPTTTPVAKVEAAAAAPQPERAPEVVPVAKIRTVALTAPRHAPVGRPIHEERRERTIRREIVETVAERPAPAPVSQPAVVLTGSLTPTTPSRSTLLGTPSSRPTIKLASMADNDTPAPRPRRASFNPLTKTTIARLAKAAGTMRASAPVEPVNTPLVLASTGDPEHGLDEVQSTVEDLRALFATDPGSSDGDEL